jgi:hypothetical protein
MTWIAWTNLGLGIWLAVAGFALRHASGAGVVEDVIGGLFVALAALWAAGAFNRRVSAFASWTVALAGIWVAIAPWVLGYAHRRAATDNDLVVGIIVVALAGVNMMVKDRAMRQIAITARPSAR